MNLCLGCMNQLAEDDVACPFCGHTIGMTAENALTEGTILENRYIVGKMISENALQTTYLGWNAQEERKVIIKEFFPRMFANRGGTGEMVVPVEHQEAYISALNVIAEQYNVQQRFQGLGCIVDVEAVIQDNNTLYGVIEFIEGMTLAETLRKNTISFDSARNVIENVAKTLAPLHKMGVAHCNICPSNIMITADGSVKILDFGAAKYKLGLGRTELVGILKEGYAPAELSSAQSAISARTDVYSLAAVMYEMLTGIIPPPAVDRMENDTLRVPSAVAKMNIPAGAENAIMNALAVYPDERTESIDAFLYELANPETRRVKVEKKEKGSGKVPLWLKIMLPVLGVLLIVTLFLAAVGVIPLFGDTLSSSRFSSEEEQVPNIINKTEEEATASLDKVSLYMSVTGRQYDENIEAGRVLTQTPVGGQLLAKYGTVEVLMSAGKEKEIAPNKMPYVEYASEAEAKAMLEALGISVTVEYAQSESVGKGIVMKQSLPADADIPENASVTITVSTGAPPRKTPAPTPPQRKKTQAPAPTQAPQTPKPTQAPTQAPQTPKPTSTQAPASHTTTPYTPKPTQAPPPTSSPVKTPPPAMTPPTPPPAMTPPPASQQIS